MKPDISSDLPADFSSAPERGHSVRPIMVAEPDRESPRQKEWQRVLFYLVGGAFSLFFLQLVARQMNPPDSALRNGEASAVLGLWDGEWEGTQTRYTLTGEKLAEYSTHIEFWSSTPHHQSVSITSNQLLTGEHFAQQYLNMVDQDGNLVSRETEPQFQNRAPFRGRYEGGELFWNRRTEEANHLIRSRISSGVLQYEELYIPSKATEAGYLLSGTFTKIGAEPKKVH